MTDKKVCCQTVWRQISVAKVWLSKRALSSSPKGSRNPISSLSLYQSQISKSVIPWACFEKLVWRGWRTGQRTAHKEAGEKIRVVSQIKKNVNKNFCQIYNERCFFLSHLETQFPILSEKMRKTEKLWAIIFFVFHRSPFFPATTLTASGRTQKKPDVSTKCRHITIAAGCFFYPPLSMSYFVGKWMAAEDLTNRRNPVGILPCDKEGLLLACIIIARAQCFRISESPRRGHS